MKLLLAIAILLNIFQSVWDEFNKIDRSNQIKKLAAKAYQQERYQESIRHYEDLRYKLNMKEENILLNLAHSYYKVSDTPHALTAYKILMLSSKPEIASIACQQTGIIQSKAGKQRMALNLLKEALKIDPNNETARYNYELLKKATRQSSGQQRLPGMKKNDSQNQQETDSRERDLSENSSASRNTHPNQNNQEEKNKEHPDYENPEDGPENLYDFTEDGNQDSEAMTSQRLRQMNMSLSKARMIMEAMRNEEIQYFQQLKKKGREKKNIDDKPDW